VIFNLRVIWLFCDWASRLKIMRTTWVGILDSWRGLKVILVAELRVLLIAREIDIRLLTELLLLTTVWLDSPMRLIRRHTNWTRIPWRRSCCSWMLLLLLLLLVLSTLHCVNVWIQLIQWVLHDWLQASWSPIQSIGTCWMYLRQRKRRQHLLLLLLLFLLLACSSLSQWWSYHIILLPILWYAYPL